MDLATENYYVIDEADLLKYLPSDLINELFKGGDPADIAAAEAASAVNELSDYQSPSLAASASDLHSTSGDSSVFESFEDIVAGDNAVCMSPSRADADAKLIQSNVAFDFKQLNIYLSEMFTHDGDFIGETTKTL